MSNIVENGEKLMQNEMKSLKELAREAKMRLKTGFWEKYKQNLKEEMEKAKEKGLSTSKVKEYYAQQVEKTVKIGIDEEEELFYQKVKNLLDEEGEVSNALGRLADKEETDKMTYDQRQRYYLRLSDRYLKAVERYKKEKEIGKA
ncbi:MAG: hypothetical protein IKC71_01575 [Clostridia bacterium]|nr:hypothetical protein [Clostridia bacterium]